jgi:hypothetical protein
VRQEGALQAFLRREAVSTTLEFADGEDHRDTLAREFLTGIHALRRDIVGLRALLGKNHERGNP